MKVRVLGCRGTRAAGHQASSFLIEESLLVDAGSICAALDQNAQLALSDVLLTHAHFDHLADLPFLVENGLGRRPRPLRIWAPKEVLQLVGEHLFNDAIWPDFTRRQGGYPAQVEFCPLPPAQASCVAGVEVRWVRTHHPVFAAGYCLQQDGAALLISGDTGPTEAFWRLARSLPQLQGVFVETSFPDRLASVAASSGHLTAATLRAELVKLDRPQVPVKVFHLKPRFLAEIVAELDALEDPRLQILHGGEEFLF